ncbi:MAG: thiamine phosphate synthase [Solirubrobacterales bacterium]
MTYPLELTRSYFDSLSDGDIERVIELAHPDVVIDRSRSRGPWRGIEHGHDGIRASWPRVREAFSNLAWRLVQTRRLGSGVAAIGTELSGRGAGSGIEISGRGGWTTRFEAGKLREAALHQSFAEALAAGRKQALNHARLYFACEGRPGGGDPAPLLDAALAGGVDVIQLREKNEMSDDEIAALALPFRQAAEDHGALFFLNDRPDLVAACGADGVHVGQDDAPVAEARAAAGPGALVGLSTHSPEQFNAALAAEGDARPDQLSAGPVWETPTKEGRRAAGLELIRHAAGSAGDAPWFAIGGIDGSNVGDVVEAGARRIVVVRAVRDAADPEAAASELRARLG